SISAGEYERDRADAGVFAGWEIWDRNLTAVIASEAKQSSAPKRKSGLLLRFAPRNDGPG
ncbi:hypothetical protein ABI069_14715, partial [Enterococcus faecium]|uniref:hypothetical protein n=1 Tax=Enterococcus faecium TaxID=1352 RepID=UPI003F424F8E